MCFFTLVGVASVLKQINLLLPPVNTQDAASDDGDDAHGSGPGEPEEDGRSNDEDDGPGPSSSRPVTAQSLAPTVATSTTQNGESKIPEKKSDHLDPNHGKKASISPKLNGDSDSLGSGSFDVMVPVLFIKSCFFPLWWGTHVVIKFLTYMWICSLKAHIAH